MDGPHQVITIGNNSYPQPWVTTPLVRSTALSRSAGCNIYLKLENVQPSGSFKSRGIGNLLVSKLAQAAENTPAGARSITHFYSSSGGNAGLACVHAAATLGCASTVVVPMTTSEYMMAKIKEAGATDVIQKGESWAEANQYLVDVVMPEAEAAGINAVYVHPFDEPEIWKGHSTMIHEIASQFQTNPLPQQNGSTPNQVRHNLPKIDAVVCSVGGGGLFSGVMEGLDAAGLSNVPVLALETVGAESLSESLAQGKLITLPRISSIATTLGARTVCKKAFEYGQNPKVKSVVYTDAEAVDACIRFADCERILVEPSCGVCIATCFEGRLKAVLPDLNKDSCVVIVVCGGSNVSFDHLKAWKNGTL